MLFSWVPQPNARGVLRTGLREQSKGRLRVGSVGLCRDVARRMQKIQPPLAVLGRLGACPVLRPQRNPCQNGFIENAREPKSLRAQISILMW